MGNVIPNARRPWLTKVDASPLVPELRDWRQRGGLWDHLPPGPARAARDILNGRASVVTVDTLDRIATAIERPWLTGEMYPAELTRRPPQMVECPCCKATFEYTRPPMPFRIATPESVFGPPDVRRPPRNPSNRIHSCEHCGGEYRPARGTPRPRYCSKSCARRAALARKHGFTQETLGPHG